MREKLTDLSAKKRPAPTKGRDDVYDAVERGLVLRITAAGHRSFAFKGRVKGQASPIWVTLGSADSMTLKQARDEAGTVRKKLARGTDPREESRVRKLTAERSEALRFEQVAMDFVEQYAKKRTKGWKETESILNRDFMPQWKDRLITEIERRDIAIVLRAVEDRASATRANRTLACIRKLFNWAIAEGLLDISPVKLGMTRGAEVERDRFLAFEEIRLLWHACEHLTQPFGQFVRLLLVTAQRRGEVATMMRAALDTERERIWTLQPKNTKAARAHIVPLSDLALEILHSVDMLKDCPYVFSTTGKTPISGFGKIRDYLDKKILEVRREESKALRRDSSKVEPLPEWRFHDLRRTAATHLGDLLGFAPHVIGSVLNHDPKKHFGITSVYAKGDLLAERRAALNAWARLLRLVIDRDVWAKVEEHLRSKKGEDDQRSFKRREEFRRMIRTDDKAWQKFITYLTKAPAKDVAASAQ